MYFVLNDSDLTIAALTAALVILLIFLAGKLSSAKRAPKTKKTEQTQNTDDDILTLLQKTEPQTPTIEPPEPPKPIDKIPETKTLEIDTKPSIVPPQIPRGSRIEQVCSAYAKVSGVLAAQISDRFGQPVAHETSLFIDTNIMSAKIADIAEYIKSNDFSVGKRKKIIVIGDGSYWIIGNLFGIFFSIWVERRIPVPDGLFLFDDFEKNLFTCLKQYYTNIW